MKKVIRLTEKDLTKIVKRAIQENEKNLDEWFFEGGDKQEEKMDSFISEVKETLKRGKHGYWDGFEAEPVMDLNTLISKVMKICDKYQD